MRVQYGGPHRVGQTAQVDLAHIYGTRTVHRAADLPRTTGNAMKGRTQCDKPIGLIDDVKPAGAYIPFSWDRWRLCSSCFPEDRSTG